MITVYWTRNSDTIIIEQEFARLTDCFAVKANGTKDKMITEYHRGHRTREAAVEHIRERLAETIEATAKKLQAAIAAKVAFDCKEPVSARPDYSAIDPEPKATCPGECASDLGIPG